MWGDLRRKNLRILKRCMGSLSLFQYFNISVYRLIFLSNPLSLYLNDNFSCYFFYIEYLDVKKAFDFFLKLFGKLSEKKTRTNNDGYFVSPYVFFPTVSSRLRVPLFNERGRTSIDLCPSGWLCVHAILSRALSLLLSEVKAIQALSSMKHASKPATY